MIPEHKIFTNAWSWEAKVPKKGYDQALDCFLLIQQSNRHVQMFREVW